jgi:hypothetical protein
MGPKPKPIHERLLAKTTFEPNSGCWLWTGNVNHKGYGQIGVGKSGMTTTHRTAYRHFKGPIASGLQVLHRCDVPCCCNPDHLWLGTHQDNIDDKMRKGRHVAGRTNKMRGSRNGNSKLTEEQVRHIKRREMTATEYSVLYGVSKTNVCDILKGRTWRHVNA